MKKLFSYFLIVISFSFLQAQDSSDFPLNSFQLSLITPMGTNGINAPRIRNKISVNILAGYNGGVKGIEVGGFANVLSGNLFGLQAAGFLNANLGYSEGAQFAGFSNITLGEFKGGIQASGFLNIIGSDAKTLQASGFLNIVNGHTLGLQASGFSNVSRGLTGAQISGFSNFNIGRFDGLQTSGFANFNIGDFNGAQISGFLNVAGSVNGFQIGILNYCTDIKNGVPIGLVSIVKNGFREFEIGGNESFYTTLGYRTGHEKFYNILSAGTSIKNNQIHWGFGYGVGSSLQLTSKAGLNVELISYHVNEDEAFTNHLNSLNKLNLTISYPLSKTVEAYFGPTFNVFVRQNDVSLQEMEVSSIVPWNFFDKTYSNDTRLTMYPGFTLGIRLIKSNKF